MRRVGIDVCAGQRNRYMSRYGVYFCPHFSVNESNTANGLIVSIHVPT